MNNQIQALQATLGTILSPNVVIDIFRHGHAEQGPVDFQRHLSEVGREQARRLGTAIADIPYDLVVSSSAPRAIHTSLIAISESRPSVSARMCFMPGMALYGPANLVLYRATEQHQAMIGNAKYLDYRTADKLGCYDTFQLEALMALEPLVKANTSRIAVFNHAVMGSFLAEAILGIFTEVTDADREILNTECPPCGCFRVTEKGVEFINFLS